MDDEQWGRWRRRRLAKEAHVAADQPVSWRMHMHERATQSQAHAHIVGHKFEKAARRHQILDRVRQMHIQLQVSLDVQYPRQRENLRRRRQHSSVDSAQQRSQSSRAHR